MRRRWTQEDVLAAIQERHRRGLPLNYAAVVADDEPLTGAARRLFGSWRAAIEAAGFDYDKIRYPPVERLPDGYWTPDRIVCLIRQRLAEGKPLAAHLVQIEDSRLYAAAAHKFGSWAAAIEAAGLDYDQIRLREVWSPERVVAEIQAAHAAGEDLSDRAISASRPDLYGAAYEHFGSWRAAVQAAGIEYASVRRTREWTREAVIAALHEAAKRGKVNSRTLPSGLLRAALRYFGSLRDAFAAAGIPARGNLGVFWTKEEIMQRLRERWEAGLPIGDQVLRREDMSLWGACKTHFGSVYTAAEAAGLPVQRPRVGGRRPGSGRKKATAKAREGG